MDAFIFQRNDLQLSFSKNSANKYHVRARWGKVESGGHLLFTADSLVQLTQERRIGIKLLMNLTQAGIDFKPWLEAYQEDGNVKWKYDEQYGENVGAYPHLLRLLLYLEEPELIALPWEALANQWPNRNISVIRAVSQPPGESERRLELPLHLTQVQSNPSPNELSFDLSLTIQRIFGRTNNSEVSQVVEVHTTSQLTAMMSGIEEGPAWARTDILHLTVFEVTSGGDDLILNIGPNSEDSVQGSALHHWLQQQQTRLLVLHIPNDRSSRRFDTGQDIIPQLLLWAHQLAAQGGPPVLLAHFPMDWCDSNVAFDFFNHFYDQIIHDIPLDHAFFINWTENDFRRLPASEQPRWREFPPQLITGPGGEDLLRPKAVLYETKRQRGALLDKIQNLRGITDRLEEPLRSLLLSDLPDLPWPSISKGLDTDFFNFFKTIETQLEKLFITLDFHPSQSTSILSLVRDRRELDTAEQLVNDVVDRLADQIQRTVNAWFLDIEGNILDRDDPLLFDKRYFLHIDIGPSDSENIVINPVGLEQILEELYELEGDHGVMLEVALFSEDFLVGPTRLDPVVDHLVWRKPRPEWPEVNIHWQRPGASTALGHLWLPRLGSSQPLGFSLKARRPGLCHLRLAIYYRNNLLQSLGFEARVESGDAGVSVTQLTDLDPKQADQLAKAGIENLSDLAAASTYQVAAATNMGQTWAERWIETAARLQTLGNQARVEYTTTADFTQLKEIPLRTVTLFTNDNSGTHAVGLKVGQWDDESGESDDWTYYQSLTEKQIEALLNAIRHDLLAASSVLETATGEPIAYSYAADNSGTPLGLARALYPLAVHGHRLYSQFFKADAQDQLNKRLDDEKQTIHVARVVGNYVIPWSVIYDRPLAYDDTLTPKYVCLNPLKQIDDGHYQGCKQAGVAPPPGVTPCLALRRAADLKDEPRPGYSNVDVYYYEDPAVCPQLQHDSKHVICPWAFWGFKHHLEQPPQQLTEDKIAPRHLKRQITVSDQPQLNVNVSTTLDFVDDHLKVLEGLTRNGKPVVLHDAGKDKYEDGKLILSARNTVIEALRNPELSLIYFYCHGGAEGDPLEAFLSVGSSDEQQIRPVTLDNENYRWHNAPLVLINGCKTVALEPRLFGDFVQKFAERGAAGVIGTEVSVWEHLAKEAAETFFTRFLNSEQVGEILLALRRQLLHKYNPLGLIYTNYCSVDLKMTFPSPAIVVAVDQV